MCEKDTDDAGFLWGKLQAKNGASLRMRVRELQTGERSGGAVRWNHKGSL